jgi:hypothetical protein
VFDDVHHQTVLLFFPLAVATLLLVSWFAPIRTALNRAVAPLAAVALGWALAIHLGTDYKRSREMRTANREAASQARAILHPSTAVMTWGGSRNLFASILLERPLIIIDAKADRGASASEAISALLERGNPIIVWVDDAPKRFLHEVASGHDLLALPGFEPPTAVFEVRPAPSNSVRK